MLFLYLQRPRWQGSQQIFERTNFFTSATRQHNRANSVYASAYRFLPVSAMNFFFLSKPPGFYRANCAMHSSGGYWSPRTSGTVPVKILTWWGQKKLAHFAVQKVAKLRASCENERRIGASFCPFKNVSGPVKRGSFTLNGTLQMMSFLTLWTRARSRFAVLKLSFVLLPIMLFFPSWFAPKTQTKRTHCLRVLPRQ